MGLAFHRVRTQPMGCNHRLVTGLLRRTQGRVAPFQAKRTLARPTPRPSPQDSRTIAFRTRVTFSGHWDIHMIPE